MKKNRRQVCMSALVLILAIACDQGDQSDDEHDWEIGKHSGTAEETTSLKVVSDIVVKDTILLKHALVSQYQEDYITYNYDRYGRLCRLDYFKNVNASCEMGIIDTSSGMIFMQDSFSYNNAGRLAEIIRTNFKDTIQHLNVSLRRSFKYNTDGRLSVIHTNWTKQIKNAEKSEYLYYDVLGQMVKKVVKDSDGQHYYCYYVYDDSGRLLKIASYFDETNALHFMCKFYYDDKNNIKCRDFYCPKPLASAISDVMPMCKAYYKYDDAINPFREFSLPLTSLMEWMDESSSGNITGLELDNGTEQNTIYYKYRYNDYGNPVLRFRSTTLGENEAIEKSL